MSDRFYLQVIETIWSYFNSDPLIPVVGQWVGDRTDQLLAVFLLIGGVAIVGWMVYIQFRLFSLLRGPQMMEDELPGDLTVLEGKLNAGTDFTMTLKMPGADETRKVTFSARQNDRVTILLRYVTEEEVDAALADVILSQKP